MLAKCAAFRLLFHHHTLTRYRTQSSVHRYPSEGSWFSFFPSSECRCDGWSLHNQTEKATTKHSVGISSPQSCDASSWGFNIFMALLFARLVQSLLSPDPWASDIERWFSIFARYTSVVSHFIRLKAHTFISPFSCAKRTHSTSSNCSGNPQQTKNHCEQ